MDILVVGAGPAALAIGTALAQRGLEVGFLSNCDRQQRWAPTYGIWGQEVDELGLAGLLAHRWHDTRSHFGTGDPEQKGTLESVVLHGRDYGLFDKDRLQDHWLECAQRDQVRWWRDEAREISHTKLESQVKTRDGLHLKARLVVDASGHQPVFVRRTPQREIAAQAAYGLVARFKHPPIEPGQFVFMDYRNVHLEPQQRLEPPTFLYAMHLGDDLYFVEETSLALTPAVPFEVLQQRLLQRLQHAGAVIETVVHEEFCLFPMNPPLPALNQRMVGFGGAGGMVHPASGYMIGSVLRRAPDLANAIGNAMADSSNHGAAVAQAAWTTLWPQELRLKHAFYCFGLSKLMGFNEKRLRQHFHTFFQLPSRQWYGFLTNSLSLGELALAMAQLFNLAPWEVRAGLLLPARDAPSWTKPKENGQ